MNISFNNYKKYNHVNWLIEVSPNKQNKKHHGHLQNGLKVNALNRNFQHSIVTGLRVVHLVLQRKSTNNRYILELLRVSRPSFFGLNFLQPPFLFFIICDKLCVKVNFQCKYCTSPLKIVYPVW